MVKSQLVRARNPATLGMGRELKVRDNVFGALIVATLEAEAGGIGFFQCFSVCVLTILAQICFMYWVFINSGTFDLGGGACSVHPTLKFTSVMVFVATQSSVLPSIQAHTEILQIYLIDSAVSNPTEIFLGKSVFATRALFLFLFSVLPEMILSVFYVPVGIHYIMVQPTLDTTILATVALQFILDIDEIIFKTFPPQFKDKCDDTVFNGKKDKLMDLMRGADSAKDVSEVVVEFPESGQAQSKAAAWAGFYSQIVYVALSVGCVFGFINHIFVCTRWNEAAPPMLQVYQVCSDNDMHVTI